MSKVTRSKLKFLIYILLQETNKINRKFFQILNDFFRTHASASRAFVSRKRFSACWGSLHSVPVRAKQTSTGRPAPVPDALTAVFAIENAGVNHHPGFKKHLLALAASTLFVVLVYTLFPVCAQRGTAPDRANCFADHLIIQRSSFAVTLIVDCTICADSELTSGLYCVNMMVYK